MKKISLTIALVLCLGALASAAKTKYYNYTFANSSGGAYCDGVSLAVTGTVASGTHVNYDCDGSASNVGGFSAAVNAAYQFEAKGATLLLSDPQFGLQSNNESETWQISVKYGTWVLDGNAGSGLDVINYGFLQAAEDGKKSEGTKPASQPK
jgi:hypothetical protein